MQLKLAEVEYLTTRCNSSSIGLFTSGCKGTHSSTRHIVLQTKMAVLPWGECIK